MEIEKLKTVIEGMVDTFDKEKIELYRKLVDTTSVRNINDYEDFYCAIISPFNDFLDVLIGAEYSSNNDYIFLLKNTRFFERHIESLIVKIEGRSCCFDKTRTIIKRLLEFFKTGNKITFDYTQEYTYHLPTKILKTHDEILAFYEGLKQFYFGSPQNYLAEILKLSKI